ncbi:MULTISPECIES: GlxA family transcriptional regulator [unclassified Pseudomonas]|uniref:GlxA family transcriptional regulator n=1 Tax=unclassified Pseudomonas TaxID=196821 RepID=UPI000C8859B8|nr:MULTISPECIES: GlxA family transcriptional regulator [unclassified Pseudomonas]PMZ87154.1 AraC family transcriptional regulator [Pseudomonas sp. FW215-T2]PNA13506.1 AraC family transcriptional regulator [Pseudomonas sp. FW215-R3]PNB38182.1 AraC family transcriptional regulator [Pseudomonas sp. FW305-131]
MHQIGLIVYPGFQVLGLAMCAAFELANSAGDEPLYRIALLSESGGLVQTSAGFAVQTEAFDQRTFDTLLVLGDNLIRSTTPGMLEFLRRASHCTRRLGSICTGAIALAQAGLLDGRRATTHWAHVPAFRKAYPNVKVEEDRIFINDGNVWTAAGMSACVDLALALVESDLGVDVARKVARQLVLYHRRSGGQSQFSVMLELAPKTDRIQAALNYAKQNLKSALSVEELASAANLSPRQFSRVFHAETGQSPAKAIENLRVESARLMMETGRHSIDVVARDTGFGDRERMRRAFIRAFGQPPQAIQRASRG